LAFFHASSFKLPSIVIFSSIERALITLWANNENEEKNKSVEINNFIGAKIAI
jgi:hypothetical protein